VKQRKTRNRDVALSAQAYMVYVVWAEGGLEKRWFGKVLGKGGAAEWVDEIEKKQGFLDVRLYDASFNRVKMKEWY
jgi:hypothetical protein